ncbi:hypothetical protein Tco_1445479 [Tanacetum coccineum]
MDDNHDMIRDRNVKFAAFQTEVDTLKQNLSKHVKEKESLSTKITVLKTEFKEEKSQIINKEIALENRNKDLENTLFKHDSLITQINANSVENSDLNAQLQEKVFAIATLKNELKILKGKNIVISAVSKPIATTFAPGMFKFDLEPLAPKLLNNREAHKDYLKYTQKQAAFLREIVEQGRSLNFLDCVLDYACKYVKRI